jgi:predicted permease
VSPGSGPLRRFRFPWRSRAQILDEIEEELDFHVDHVAAELRHEGWTDADARAEARRRFGNMKETRDYCRVQDLRREQDTRRMTMIDDLLQDLRYGARSLRSAPGFTVAALLTLALGIGANTAIFSVVRAVLLEQLPFRDPERIIRVYHANPKNDILQGSVSEPDFLDWRRAANTAESMGGFWYADGLSGVDLTGSGNPERLAVTLVTDGFFETLGRSPLYGRTLTPEDQLAGRNRVVVFSHGLWTRRFGADAAIVGRTVTLNGQPFEVVGVMPPDFTYPAQRQLDAWIPLSFFGPDDIGRSRGAHFLAVIARVKAGTTEAQLRSELTTMAERLSREYPENPGWTSVTTEPVAETIVGDVRRPLVLLMAAVAMLLLIACVNIAGLLLARASGRQSELAVRAALGAGRGRIARQLLTESVLLAALGGVLGAILGYVAVRAFASWGGDELPRPGVLRVDGFVLAFCFAVSLVSGLLFGLVPALRVSRNLEGSLRAGSRASVGGAGGRLRSSLVVVEVALAVVLVVGAALTAKSFARLVAVDTGFRTDDALVVMTSVRSPEHYLSVLDTIRALPGVESAGSIRDLPLLARGEIVRPDIAGRPTPPGGSPTVQLHQVSTDYFKAIGIPLLGGRPFELSDRRGTPLVTVINEEFARRTWPGEDPVGQALRFGQTEVAVVGVVGNVRQSGLAEPIAPAMYLHSLQNFRSRMTIVIRTAGNPLAMADTVRRAIWAQAPDQTITRVTTLQEVTGRAVARPQILAWLLAVFGILGLVLGALGIFGVLAYSVAQRQREIGVRLALGAAPRSVLAMVLGQGMLLSSLGIVFGVIAAALLTRFMESVLFGIEPTDPWTFVQVIAVLLAAAALASWLPARRAVAIDPVTALRNG